MDKKNLYFLRWQRWKRLDVFRETLFHEHNCIDLISDEDNFNEELDSSMPCWSDNKGIVFIRLPRIHYNDSHSFFKKNEKLLLDYKGKIILLTDGDNCAVLHHLFFTSGMLSRIDAFVALNKSLAFISIEVADKVVLLPRFIPLYRFDKVNVKKIKKMVFYGQGHDMGRIEAVKRIKNSNLDKYFEGGFTNPVSKAIIAGRRYQIGKEYYKDLSIDTLDRVSYQNKLYESLISLCADKWSFRFGESMAASCAVVSTKLDLPNDEDFLYRDKVVDLLFTYKRDQSDLLDVCQYCLDHEDECIERGKEGREVYEKYWELNMDGTYKDNVWQDIQNQFLELGVVI